ncbi:MAG: hypothetical protein IJR55_05870 [Clostridia bacterium]|nr:hypothetical protein [Clostridia bacterium]
MKKYYFTSAIPVWAEGKEYEKNLWLEFSTIIKKQKNVTLSVTGSSVYNIRINGKFIAFGPARCAHGFYRVDEIDISELLTNDENTLSITVAGYNVNSFYTLDQPSFLCAELCANGIIIAATGKTGFSCRVVDEHEQKVGRYTYQRTFVEIYDLREIKNNVTDVVPTEKKTFIYRDSALNIYPYESAEKVVFRGKYHMGDHKAELKYPRQLTIVDDVMYKGYRLDEITTDLHLLCRNIDIDDVEAVDETAENVKIADDNYAVFKMKHDTTGKVSLEVTADNPADVLITFSEVLSDSNKVDYRFGGMTRAILWHITAGKQTLESFEPYSMQYIAVYPINGSITVDSLGIICFEAEKPDVKLKSDDKTLGLIFDAAIETYRQNTFTIYMDCPSRERAGWLCDSFFTSRVEKVLTGKSEIEHVFLENFILPDSFRALPHGMLPMCYPGDHFNGSFIPNWAMWYVIELEEYFKRTSDLEFIAAAKEKVFALLKYFEKFENSDGLLEKLESWVFVEWSKANELTQDVNFPSNMLYAKMLRSVSALYGDKSYSEKADKIAKTINETAINENGFYCDNAIRQEDGKLTLSGECTETCQYYAFFCGVATVEKNNELWQRMLYDFGPQRVKPYDWPNFTDDAKWKEIYPSNTFIGNYLRLELLFINGEYEKLMDNILGFFAKMAKVTGTLWENENPNASCNHGFASHVLYWLDGMGYIEH